jgi:hypothetical protein
MARLTVVAGRDAILQCRRQEADAQQVGETRLAVCLSGPKWH